jgi:hypothetical protein
MGCICSNTGARTDTRGKAVLKRDGNFTYFLFGKDQPEDFSLGEGCRKAAAWSTPFTKQQTQFKIEEFWESRRTGNPDAWRTLRLALDTSTPEEAMTIAMTAGLQSVDGLLCNCMDESGFVYELPPYVMNPAMEYGKPSEQPTVAASSSSQGKPIEIKCRTTLNGDISLPTNTHDTVEEAKTKLATLMKMAPRQIRVFFNGREMKNELQLEQYGVKDKTTVTVVSLNS